jgi:hypothetical protein
MTDQQLVVSTLHEVGQVLAEHLTRGDAAQCLKQSPFDRGDAIEGLETGRGSNAFTVSARNSSNVFRCFRRDS